MKQTELNKLNLQLFAEENPEDKTEESEETKTEETAEETKTEETKEEKTFEDQQKEWQAETDRRVNKALEKYKKEQEEKERLARLTEEERKQELETQKEKEIAELRKQIEVRDVEREILKTLQDNELLDAASIFKPENYLGENKEQLTADIEAYKKSVENETAKRTAELRAEIEKVTAGVSEQILKGKKPEVPAKEMTKERFDKMSYADKVELYNSNAELYKQLSK